MKILIAGGTGFIGKFLTQFFLEKKYSVTILSRSKRKIKSTFNNKVPGIIWDDLENSPTEMIKNFDFIINLCGEGIANKRWSDSQKQKLLKSRLIPTKKLVDICIKLGDQSPQLINASAVGIYDIQKPVSKGLPTAYTEQTELDFKDPPTFATLLTRRWERATWPAAEAGIRVVNTRFGVVLGPKGGSLTRITLPFKLYIGGPIGSGHQPFSWVSIVDLAHAIQFLFKHADIVGPVNVVSPECIQQAKLANEIGKKLDRPSSIPTPAFILKLAYGEMAEELLLNGQHVYPKKLLDQGFEFQYPDIESALEFALKNNNRNKHI